MRPEKQTWDHGAVDFGKPRTEKDTWPISMGFWEKRPEKQTWYVPVWDLKAKNRKAVIVAKHSVFEFLRAEGRKPDMSSSSCGFGKLRTEKLTSGWSIPFLKVEGRKPRTRILRWLMGFLSEVICMNICTTVCDAIQIDRRTESWSHVHECRHFMSQKSRKWIS